MYIAVRLHFMALAFVGTFKKMSFQSCYKTVKVEPVLSCVGRLFQSTGPALLKALSPQEFLVTGSHSRWPSVPERRVRLGWYSWMSSAR